MSFITTYSSTPYSASPSASVVSSVVTTAVASVSSSFATSSPVASSISQPSSSIPWLAEAYSRSNFMSSVTAGLFIGAVLFGVHTITLAHALAGAWRQKTARERCVLLAVPAVLWTVSLIYEICSIVFMNQAWEAGQEGIENRSAFQYYWNNSNPGLTIAGAAAFLVSTVVTDGFLCVRIVGLWKKLWVSIPLALLTLVTYAWDLIQVIGIANETDESLLVVPYGDTFIIPVILAQSLHAIFAVLLVFHIATVRGETGGRRICTKDLLVESVLPYALVSVLFMGTYCGFTLAANVFLPMLLQIQGITIDLLITRRGRHEGFSAIDSRAAPSATAQTPITNFMNDNEKLTLAMMASKWEYDLDKKEPIPPQYSESV